MKINLENLCDFCEIEVKVGNWIKNNNCENAICQNEWARMQLKIMVFEDSSILSAEDKIALSKIL